MVEYIPTKWNLNDLFSSYDSAEMEKAFKDLEIMVSGLEDYRGKLSATMDMNEFLSIIQQEEESTRLGIRVGQYASLWFAEDTQNQEATNFQAKVQHTLTTLNNRVLFLSLWFKSLTDEEANRFLEASGEYQYWLQEIRKFKPYTLSEPEEKIVNLKNVTGVHALTRLYDSMTNKYVFKVKVNDEIKELNREELMSLVYQSNPEVRANAYKELYRVYGEEGPILGQIYQTIVRDFKSENLDVRSYPSPISYRNLENDIPDEVVHALMSVAQKNAGIFQKYFQLKAKWLKLDKLRRYDIYAPVSTSNKQYTYDQAVNMVLEAFNKFDPKLAKLTKRIFEKNHIDSQVRKGKMSGAFCSYGDPTLTPFVLVSYNNTASDIATLAHELGHALHGMLAEHQNVFNYSSTLPLAETASVFCEMVLIDHFLEVEQDEEVKRDMLFKQVSDAFATIMRQIFFALFEREAHEMIANNATISQLNTAYMKNLKTQFGEAVLLPEEFQWEWVSIPHIYHVPFYVYAYAFGNLLVLALYSQFKKEGSTFIQKYLDILSAGGSKAPIEILDQAGFNIRTPEFWQAGFDTLAEMVGKLEDIPIK